MKLVKKLAAAAVLSAFMGTSALAGELVINSDASDPAPKAAFAEIVKKFEAANPDVTVKYNLYDHESYKTTIRNWLVTTPPDVVFWYAGNRMKTFVDRGLFMDVSDLWKEQGMEKDYASAMPAMTIDGKQWGVPYTYYQWGVYYRQDIFEKYGLEEPKTYEELVAVSKVLKENGVTPVSIGTKFLWTAAGWFDYLDLRTNGLDFHLRLMEGKESWTSPQVKAVFKEWAKMVEPGYFLDNHASYSWQEAQAPFYSGDAAMYLIGNFFAANFTPEQREKIGFFQFPRIKADVPMYEDAPMDTLHIPSAAKNKEDAIKFLKFMTMPENATLVNEALQQIPTNSKAKVLDDKYLDIGVKMLGDAAGTAQFFDRDTNPEMAKTAMKGLQEYMVHPERLDAILKRIDAASKRIFKKK